jgi:hypothetical protein
MVKIIKIIKIIEVDATDEEIRTALKSIVALESQGEGHE